MSDYHYSKHISGATTYHEGSLINCYDADISARGSFIPAPTFTAEGFNCDTSAKVVSAGSATVVIDQLTAETVEFTVQSSATMHIKALNVKTATILVEASATLQIDGGQVGNISGTVQGASTGVCKAVITGRDDVQVKDASTWNA
ncbi:hypothetical protein [Methylomagnum ishizawai]|uniref:hypothetical protein n=1 Tax=Methylomagnum ishizawai TaxID=1760988 RepID=UPI001C3272B5|nr:hypothetical protein [Methylomagnum ishizawai]BBL76483.1 hypothetical protein MishRS11D_35810 [Methylomagnum ishizawai]